MNKIGSIINSAQKLLAIEVLEEFTKQIDIVKDHKESPMGAIFMGIHILEHLGFPRYIDELLGEEHTPIEQLRNHYNNKPVLGESMMPSTGIILSLMVADMFARPRYIDSSRRFEEIGQNWKTGPLLGIDPSLLSDERIGKVMDDVGGDLKIMEDALYSLIGEAGISLNKFGLGSIMLELDEESEDAAEQAFGHGENSFCKHSVSLLISSDLKLPVGFFAMADNTNDTVNLPDVYRTINSIADDGEVELIMAGVNPTLRDILFLKEHEDERMVHWISPLKTDLLTERAKKLIDGAYCEDKWVPIKYRSVKERKEKIAPPLKSFETTWLLTEKTGPEQTMLSEDSTKTNGIEVRAVFYRHELQAERKMEIRQYEKNRMEMELQEFLNDLNKHQYREFGDCKEKLAVLLNSAGSVKEFLQWDLLQKDNGSISLIWSWNEAALDEEIKYDGIFALLTNYTPRQVNRNHLVSRYNKIFDIKIYLNQDKGLLNLERILYTELHRFNCLVFLKIISRIVLFILRLYAEQEGIKTTEEKIQESMGDMLLLEHSFLPLEIKSCSLVRDTELNQLFRKIFSLPEPLVSIKALNEIKFSQIDAYVAKWLDKRTNNQKPL